MSGGPRPPDPGSQWPTGLKYPSDATITAGDRDLRTAAEIGSRNLLAGIQRYFARGGRA